MFSLVFVKLLEKKKRVQLKDMGEDLECLCQIMRTVGPRLDHEKAKVTRLEQHFKFTTCCYSCITFTGQPVAGEVKPQ